MPVQHTLFGRPIPHVPPRRVAQMLAGIAVFALVTLVFTLPSSIPGPSLSKFTDVHSISLPKIPTKLSSPSILHPFRPAAHAPPVQENSTSGEASWYSNWNWLSPFSSSVTLDERRSLLPPLRVRPAIYTYYDHTLKKDADTKAAESDILATWRRAWWAQGFKPIILGPGDAMKNPLYEEVQKLKLGPDLQTEMLKWLAWEHMGKGILSHYLALPMGSHEDSLLSYLRRGEYPKLSRYRGLDGGFFTGGKAEITAALKAALASPNLNQSTDFIKAVPAETFNVDPSPQSIALYDSAVVTSKYGKKGGDIIESTPAGLKKLNQLINAHLHNNWQNIFSSGVAVLKPLPKHMTAIIEPAVELANLLIQCPDSPIPSSCPPNRPKCKPCVSAKPLIVSTPAQYRNSSTLFTIGIIPHPYTLMSLNALRDTITVPYIRRETDRDPYLTTTTRELLGNDVSTAPRIIRFKEAVASPHGTAHSLWYTAEKTYLPTDLAWHFGFALPANALPASTTTSPAPGSEQPLPAEPRDGPVASEAEVVHERLLLEQAKAFVQSKKPDQVKLKEAVVSWSLADIEAWRFARAYRARSTQERIRWDEEEKKFAGGVGVEIERKEGGGGMGRWFDSV